MSTDSRSITAPPSDPKAPLSLQKYSLLAVLDLDGRPTFVLDLSSEERASSLSFVNQALKASQDLLQGIQNLTSSASLTAANIEIWHQLTRPDRPSSTEHQCAFRLGNKPWSCFTIDQRWRVFSTGSPNTECLAGSGEDSTQNDALCKAQQPVEKRGLDALDHASSQTDGSTAVSSLARLLSSSTHNQYVCNFDWSRTILGPLADWPAVYIENLKGMLADPQPCMLMLGPEYVILYNEPAASVLEEFQSSAIGFTAAKKFEQSWTGKWAPIFQSVYDGGNTRMLEDVDSFKDQIPPILSERYASVALKPMFGEKGQVVGIESSFRDVTLEHLLRRHNNTIDGIAALNDAASIEELYENALSCLHENDFPQALLYTTTDDQDSSTYKLRDSIGWSVASDSAHATFELRDTGDDLARLISESKSVEVPMIVSIDKLPQSLLEGLQSRGYGDACKGIAICHIRLTDSKHNMGCLMLGLGTRLPHNKDFEQFLITLQRTLATTLEAYMHSHAEYDLSAWTLEAKERAERRFTRFSSGTSMQ